MATESKIFTIWLFSEKSLPIPVEEPWTKACQDLGLDSETHRASLLRPSLWEGCLLVEQEVRGSSLINPPFYQKC